MTKTRKSNISLLQNKAFIGYAMVLPVCVILGLLIVGPILYALVLSLYQWRLMDIGLSKPFVGLQNYRELLQDRVFWAALRNTLSFVFASVVSQMLLGFLLSLAVYHVHRGKQLFNALILLPIITAPVVVGLIWRFLLDPQFGLVNYYLNKVIPVGEVPWLSQSSTALASIVIVDIWQMTPFVILILHAGMCSIDEAWFEAARVDGAHFGQVVWNVILPVLQPLIVLVGLLRVMDTLRIFDTVYVLTRGGPGIATETLALYTYKAGFSQFRMGYAMALSVITLGLVVVFSVVLLRVMKREAR